MYYLACEHDLHVVESLHISPQQAHLDGDFPATTSLQVAKDYSDLKINILDNKLAEDVIDESDVEATQSTSVEGNTICTYRPTRRSKQPCQGPPPVPNKRIKQAQNQPTTKPSPSQDSELPCIPELLAGDTNLWLSHTNSAGDYISAEPCCGCVGDARNPVKTSQQCLTAAPTNDPGEVLQQKHKLIVSAMLALTKILGALQLVKKRREMAKNISPTVAESFMRDCYTVLRMIQDCSRGEKVSALPRQTNLPKNALQDKSELEALNLQMVITGWEYLKLTNGLLKDK
ncbi:hypothetical protein PCANC_19081 [Puccinia coronata f. sp. avenae]|uniref:Uncharacterized protein n=1 Tax=Puccinia coronata f. sp. avenae TaxID=200324 RepID=A0A2N5UB10_9BASI|nr:hypothetical protein PCANC_19081 [Puccinia coronata f. sp. avenae]